SLLYIFNMYGHHAKTLSTSTGATVFDFTYDGDGLLTEVIDGDGDVTYFNRDYLGRLTSVTAPDGQVTSFAYNGNGYFSNITNPAFETNHFTYTAKGLMKSRTDARGGLHTFTYDGDGRLTKDTNPAGGFWELTRSESPGEFSVDVSSAMGRTDTYFMAESTNGNEWGFSKAPTGLQTTYVNGPNGGHLRYLPDGTVYYSRDGGDPRFDIQSPITTFMSMTTPSGLMYEEGRARAVSLANPDDPLSLQSMTNWHSYGGLHTYTTHYDAASNTTTSTTPMGRVTTAITDDLGRPLSASVTGLETAYFNYDARGRLTATSSGSGALERVASFTYDTDGNVETATDPVGRVTSFVYDPVGRVTRTTLPDLREVNYSYDEHGNLTTVTPSSRPAHTFTYTSVDLTDSYSPPDVLTGTDTTTYVYNLDKQPTLVTRPDGATIAYAYDSPDFVNVDGLLDTITIPRGVYSYVYDQTTGQISSIIDPTGGTLNYTYDGFLELSETSTGEVSGSVSRTIDNFMNLTSRSVNGTNTINFTYDTDKLLTGAGALSLTRDGGNGLLTGTTLGGVSTSIGYSTFGETSSYSATSGGGAVFTNSYIRDKIGRITERTEMIDGLTKTYAYTYDTVSRLIEVTQDGLSIGAYTYDDNGNRTSFTGQAGSLAGIYDNQDRLLSYGTASYTYSANGELESKTDSVGTTDYYYDVLGNLMSAVLPDSTQIDYVIDARDRRVGKKINGTLTQGFIYEGSLNPIAELDGAGSVVSRFVYGIRTNVPSYMIKDGVTYRIISDHLGSPRVVIDAATGSVVQRMDFDEFGNVTYDSNPG
ncbi:MAG: hypothetical protein V3T30_04975, partial [Thermodesulfobacteriota bacterium]